MLYKGSLPINSRRFVARIFRTIFPNPLTEPWKKMRITKVEAILLRPMGPIDTAIGDGSQDGVLVRVHTDEGITGLGEIDSSPSVAKAIIDAPPSHKICSGLGALLVGENPLEIGRLWQKMYKGSLYFGRRGAAIHAISGVEIALWDIAGKAAGKPIHALLGGARRSKLKAYASTLMPDTPKEAARVIAAQRKAGFNAVKLGWGPLGQSAALDVELVAAARKAGSDDFELMIDIGKGWQSVREGIDRARRMEEYRLAWIEEPFWPDDYAKYAALAAAASCTLGAPASSRRRRCMSWRRWRKPNTWNTASRSRTSISGW